MLRRNLDFSFMINMIKEWMEQHKSWDTRSSWVRRISAISGRRGPGVRRELLSPNIETSWLNIVHARRQWSPLSSVTCDVVTTGQMTWWRGWWHAPVLACTSTGAAAGIRVLQGGWDFNSDKNILYIRRKWPCSELHTKIQTGQA